MNRRTRGLGTSLLILLAVVALVAVLALVIATTPMGAP